jgi:hypothetical protein
VNLLAHIRVARVDSDDPRVWLGAALPDLQREAGVSIGDPSAWPPAIRAGIECHRATDELFHELAVFRAQSVALTRALLDAGVPRGAARAVGHAGWELLFDGALIGDGALVDAYLTAMAVEVSDPAWHAALARRVQRGTPTFYADPNSVAELLWRVLSGRRLLAFDRSHLAAVTTGLADAQPDIAASVDEVFAALT